MLAMRLAKNFRLTNSGPFRATPPKICRVCISPMRGTRYHCGTSTEGARRQGAAPTARLPTNTPFDYLFISQDLQTHGLSRSSIAVRSRTASSADLSRGLCLRIKKAGTGRTLVTPQF